MFEKSLLLILGALVGAMSFMIKRRLERKPTLEALDVQARILAVHKEMKAQGLTKEDLSNLEIELITKPRAVQRFTGELEQATHPLLEATEGHFLSQAEMNIRASNNLDIAKLKMDHILDELKLLLDAPEHEALLKAQLAWESYCVEQAEATAVSYRGGTIYSLIYLAEIERLTVERTARLQADLDELRRLES